jgi:hypothetical protein
MQVLMEKNPAPVQNFHVFGSSYVKSYTGVLPKELGWAGWRGSEGDHSTDVFFAFSPSIGDQMGTSYHERPSHFLHYIVMYS